MGMLKDLPGLRRGLPGAILWRDGEEVPYHHFRDEGWLMSWLCVKIFLIMGATGLLTWRLFPEHLVLGAEEMCEITTRAQQLRMLFSAQLILDTMLFH